MKKNDGYVIIYVVFVIIFLCIVAVGTCTSALNNLKTQTAYIKQMQARYEAEGAIEKFMAEVCVACKGLEGSGFDNSGSATEAAKNAVAGIIEDAKRDDLSLSDGLSWSGDNSHFTVTATKVVDTNKAVATIDFSLKITLDEYRVGTGKYEDSDGIEDTVPRFKYQITDVTSKYISYTLESTGGKAE